MDITEKALGIIRFALAEDLGSEGDITSKAIFDSSQTGRGRIVCHEACVIAGQPIAAKVFELQGAEYEPVITDGLRARKGDVIGNVQGRILDILSGERTALNFLSRLCGIATTTQRLVELAKPYEVEIMDTRKTTPGMRVLEKYAVSVGGGKNHRMGLFDGILIKDNHITCAGGIELAVRRVRNKYGETYPVEVEATTLAEVREAVAAQVDVIMLDNMKPDEIKKAVAMVGGKAKVEVSGGLKPHDLPEYVKLGMNYISLGFITHSSPAIDISLEVCEVVD